MKPSESSSMETLKNSPLDCMLHISTGESGSRGYVSEYLGNKRYKLMSKLCKEPYIFWVFYEQRKNGCKTILHSDVSYSDRAFRCRVAELKKVYGIKDFQLANLSGV